MQTYGNLALKENFHAAIETRLLANLREVDLPELNRVQHRIERLIAEEKANNRKLSLSYQRGVKRDAGQLKMATADRTLGELLQKGIPALSRQDAQRLLGYDNIMALEGDEVRIDAFQKLEAVYELVKSGLGNQFHFLVRKTHWEDISRDDLAAMRNNIQENLGWYA